MLSSLDGYKRLQSDTAYSTVAVNQLRSILSLVTYDIWTKCPAVNWLSCRGWCIVWHTHLACPLLPSNSTRMQTVGDHDLTFLHVATHAVMMSGPQVFICVASNNW